MNAHTILEIGAWHFGALAVLLLSGGFVLGPAGEKIGARLYARESDRLASPVKPVRLTVGELATRFGHWLAAKVLRLDRQEAGE